MPLRFALLAALALTVSACGDDDAPDPSSDASSSVTDAIRTPSTPSTDDAAADGSADPAEDDAGVAASPKEDGAAASGKPDGGTAAASAPAAGGKPSAASSTPAGAGAQRHTGTLADGDETLESGEFADGYTIEATAGQVITAELASGDFDAYLILRPPSGEQVDNDDAEDTDGTDARITHRATESGTYRVVATTYEPGQTGAYRLSIQAGGR